MAVTAGGSPYVESSDLVANYPGASLALANRVDQVMQAPTQNAQTGTTYTAALLDAGKNVTLSNAAAVTLTIPAQATVAWAENTQLNFLNIGAGTVTITPAATVTINGTPLTLNTSEGGSLVRTASNTWTFIRTGAGGKVLQVVRATDSTDRSTSSTSMVDANLSVTITPQLATSNILLIWTARWAQQSSDYIFGQITDASNVAISGASEAIMGDPISSTSATTITVIGYHSPATTSATTYKCRFSVNTGTGTLSNSAQTAQLFAIEVAA